MCGRYGPPGLQSSLRGEGEYVVLCSHSDSTGLYSTNKIVQRHGAVKGECGRETEQPQQGLPGRARDLTSQAPEPDWEPPALPWAKAQQSRQGSPCWLDTQPTSPLSDLAPRATANFLGEPGCHEGCVWPWASHINVINRVPPPTI